MDVKSLYVIKRDSGVCLYHKDFREPLFDPHLISSFISAMISFFERTNQSVESVARAFEGTDYKIVVEFGDWTVGALVVNSDREFLREKLRAIVSEFEKQFSILRYVDIDLAVYTRFEKTVMSEFIFDEITEETIIRKVLNWDLITTDPDVRSFLQLLPEQCSVKDAAEFLEMPIEMAIHMAAEAVWEKAVTLSQPVKPDDIYQTTMLADVTRVDEVSPETVRALAELDGETPLAIVAERVKTSDLKRFLDEIALLVRRKKIEKVPPAQATLVLQTSVLQGLLSSGARLIGLHKAKEVFAESKQQLISVYPWLAYVDLEEGVDVDIRSSLITASVKGTISPPVIYDGFRALMQFVTKRLSAYIGVHPTNCIVRRVKESTERQFPSRSYEVQWEAITVQP
ncbi:MAG: hypothetical protein DRO93_02755 [Candidatus Thorarchaeota archaeon]|nr:MAG: hypothetical protein DRO93_02755 [Candidatus Thorarchaeota archaeon]